MGKFNEWLTHRGDNDGLKHGRNTDLVTSEDSELVSNQLSQFVDRVAGILHDLSEEKKAEMVGKFIAELKSRL